MEKVKDEYQIALKDVESPVNITKKTYKNLKNALKYVKQMQDSEDVEYGLFIKSL